MSALLKPYDTAGMVVLDAVFPHTSYIRNNGDGTFNVTPLPKMVQVAPINGMVVADFNNDGDADVLMIGNDYGNEVFSGRHDACRGIMLAGDGLGSFQYYAPGESGFSVEGDGKALARIRSVAGDRIIATQNADSLRVFQPTMPRKDVKDFLPMPTDSRAELLFNDGKKEKIEFHYGSGYLSQSTRSIGIPSTVKQIIVYDYSGKSRVIDFSGLAHAH